MAPVLKELRRGIVYSSSAQKIWIGFKERFDKINATRIYHMHKEIGDLTQGTLSVSIFFSLLNDLWDEFESVIPFPGCDCEKSKTFVEYLHLQKTMKFLMGLNETYSPQTSQILMMDPTPGLNQVYSMIVHEESQHLNGSFGTHSGILGSGPLERDTNIFLTANVSTYGPNAYGSSLYCTYCHKNGHVREFCRRRIGNNNSGGYGNSFNAGHVNNAPNYRGKNGNSSGYGNNHTTGQLHNNIGYRGKSTLDKRNVTGPSSHSATAVNDDSPLPSQF
ncbi:hypothetical protein FXO38_19472 [Capsicum annuum]|uniref:uncharacterized protein LOC107862940 n=1 Tax=Capsicum annuum TaxID=4072 RepID=UPI0007BFE813|nr:uncharacterized protein LOC107862940 [Capsicum annuum]KAF3645815.1 hypothetical protein FXO38_19472 [Capsicum annuum]KAF3680190.1 hypothetical protein FXO37_03454 [Capsicum annuum]